MTLRGFNQKDVIHGKFYVARPTLVEAEQIDSPFEVKTLEGTMQANAGDYLIRGIAGELYPCKREIFEMKYSEQHLERNELMVFKEKMPRHLISYLSLLMITTLGLIVSVWDRNLFMAIVIVGAMFLMAFMMPISYREDFQ